jgi:hypothetical protein
MALRSVCASSVVLLFAACAPLAELRPANGMMDGKTYEIGNAGVQLGPRPYVEEERARIAQVWFSAEASKRFDFTGVAAFDKSAAAVGAAVRLKLLKLDRFAWATELQAGYAFAGLAVPLSVRLIDQTWFYVSPRVGTLGRDLTVAAPVGLSIRLYDGFILRVETQVSWADFKSYNRRVHLALGVAAQW